MRMFDFLIVGAGFAGSVLAERIANVLNKQVLVIEHRDHIGGNCYDFKNEAGIIIHKYGPHLFHTDFKDVWDYLSNFTEWRSYDHRVLAFIDSKKVPIPFNLNTLYDLFPQSHAIKIEATLLEKYAYGSKVPILEFMLSTNNDLKFLAQYIYDKFYKNYTLKQWGVSPEKLDPEVIARVPVYISHDNRYFTDKYQAVPEKGYTQIFKKMLNNPNIKIMLNTDFKKIVHIDTETKTIYFRGNKFDGNLIFTGPIDELFNYKFGELPYRTLDLRFEVINKNYFQEVAVVNYPNDYDFTRITEFKHIHPAETKQTVILKEYPRNCEISKDIPYYPLLDKQAKETYEKYKDLSEKFKNLILIGRLAEFRYYDMDDVVKRALDVFEEVLK